MAATTDRTSGFLREALAELRRSYSPSTEDDAWLVRSQLSLALDGAKSPAILGPLAAIVLALGNASWVPAWRLILWPALFIATGILSALIYGQMLKHAGTSIADTRRLARAFTWLSFVQIAAWCAAALIIWVPGQDTNHILIGVALVVSLTGWTALGTYHYATGVAPLPLFLGVMTLGSLASERWVTTVTILAYWILMAMLFQSNYGTRRKMLMLERERGRLVDDLKAAKHVSDSARDKAETAVRAKAAFLANMSHELRTPLNAILGFSEIINTKALGTAAVDQYAEYGGYIHGSGKHLLSLINGILELAKIESGKLALSETDVDLKILCEEAVQASSGRALSGGVSLGIEIAPDFPTVCADERALRQILSSLLSNAIKFTPAQGRVTCFARMEPGGDLAIGIADTGIGIAPEFHAKVFESFGQGRHDAVVGEKGTGLGLQIVKGLAAAHGGRVSLRSAPGEGTRLTVILPGSRARQRLRAAS
jgi:two-component system cell cycle sensor histidine kinase PleC